MIQLHFQKHIVVQLFSYAGRRQTVTRNEVEYLLNRI